MCSRRPNAPAAVPPFCGKAGWPLWRIWSGLRASRSKTFCISFAREEEAARFAGTFPEAVPRGTEVELPLSGSADRLVKALAGYEVRDLSTRSQTLEELFLSYYGEEAAK